MLIYYVYRVVILTGFIYLREIFTSIVPKTKVFCFYESISTFTSS